MSNSEISILAGIAEAQAGLDRHVREMVSWHFDPETGCPWDKEQTSESLVSYMLEEAYEVIEAIDDKNWDGLKEELGDLIFHIIFQATIAKENKIFELN